MYLTVICIKNFLHLSFNYTYTSLNHIPNLSLTLKVEKQNICSMLILPCFSYSQLPNTNKLYKIVQH